jgi:hypothetical protein
MPPTDGADDRPARQRLIVRSSCSSSPSPPGARINVYEAFVDGAKEGFGVAVQIIPYLIAMLVAISVFRTTGCMDYVIDGIAASCWRSG